MTPLTIAAADDVHSRKRGSGDNARGIRQFNGELVAVVNNGSNCVALYKRVGDALRFDRLVSTTSAPLSVDFGNDHMYVAGATTIDSFVFEHDSVGWLDGTAIWSWPTVAAS